MDEIIDLVDFNGNYTGKTALKSEAHKNGWPHNTIHLWLYNKNQEILLQQRSHKKSIYPLLWDVSVAGHIDAGESFKTAAIRETEEEIGLTLLPPQLHKIGVYKHFATYQQGRVNDFEFHHVYVAELTKKVSELLPQPDEVEALKLVSLQEFHSLLKNSENNSHFVPSNKSYYLDIVKAVEHLTNKK